MKVDEVLHMNSGRGETSYATNSLLQQKVISMTRPITEDAITKLVSTFPNGETATLAIAELGCASGPNTFLAVSDLIKAVLKLTAPPREFHVLLNDLPSNDFNTIFTSLHQFRKQLKKETALSTYVMLFNGVPGSFYGRLFPAESLHFAHSSYSLHWLSRVPPGLEGNGGSISISSCSSMSVFEAYYGQFRKDFSSFLRCRAVEMVTGGRMVLTLLGRRNEDGCGNDCYYIWELMSTALNQMAHEGFISKERLDSFNIPFYMPSPKEIEAEVQKQRSFTIDRIEVTEVSWNPYEGEVNEKDGGYNVAKYMRAVAEPLLATQFGSNGEIIDEVFQRYRVLVSERMVTEKTNFVNVTMSLAKY
ncbi:S-adenosyl-L-methionine:benzoic acid/salicylic acid carboxyl methyltransferase 2 [Linum perenne]